MNSMVKSGGMEELKFMAASPCISGRGEGVRIWLRISYVMRPILNCTLCLTGSQWSFFS